MKKNFKLFCFGFGQVAKYFVKNLVENEFKFELITTNTTKTQFKSFNGLKHKSYYFSNDLFDEELLKDLRSSNKILISIPPKKDKDIVLKIFNKIFQKMILIGLHICLPQVFMVTEMENGLMKTQTQNLLIKGELQD